MSQKIQIPKQKNEDLVISYRTNFLMKMLRDETSIHHFYMFLIFMWGNL